MPAITATPSPRHGITDAFRDAELLAVALDQALRGDAEETHRARATTSSSATRRCARSSTSPARLAAYPPVPTFIELQKQLSAAIDNEAAALAARPVPASAAGHRLTRHHHGRRRPCGTTIITAHAAPGNPLKGEIAR